MDGACGALKHVPQVGVGSQIGAFKVLDALPRASLPNVCETIIRPQMPEWRVTI